MDVGLGIGCYVQNQVARGKWIDAIIQYYLCKATNRINSISAMLNSILLSAVFQMFILGDDCHGSLIILQMCAKVTTLFSSAFPWC